MTVFAAVVLSVVVTHVVHVEFVEGHDVVPSSIQVFQVSYPPVVVVEFDGHQEVEPLVAVVEV